jgi:hypothetical protein
LEEGSINRAQNFMVAAMGSNFYRGNHMLWAIMGWAAAIGWIYLCGQRWAHRGFGDDSQVTATANPIHRPGRCIRSAAHPHLPFGPAHISLVFFFFPISAAEQPSLPHPILPPSSFLRIRPFFARVLVPSSLEYWFTWCSTSFVSIDGS